MEVIKKYFKKFNHIYEFEQLPQNSIEDLKNLIINKKKPVTDNHLVASLASAYYILNGDKHSAMEFCLIGIKLKCTESMFTFATIYESKKDFGNAIKYYKMATENKLLSGIKTKLHAYVSLGLLYEKIGDMDKALEQYKIGSDNGSEECLLNAGAIYGERKDYDNFRAYTKKAIELGSKDGYLNYVTYLCHHEEEQVENYVHTAIKKGCSATAIICARYYAGINNHKTAIKYYKLAIKAGNNNAQDELLCYLDYIR